MRYGMVIDTERCTGCHACALACKLNNNLPKGVWWNDIKTEGGDTDDTASGEWPNNEMRFWPIACQHCKEPLCLSVCPTGATQQREDGIVIVDSELCIGCEACKKACPYDVRVLESDEPEYYQDIMLGQFDAPQHKGGSMGKCTFCANLIDRGKQPACIAVCPIEARTFGDLDDPESRVSKLLASGREVVRLHEEAGTDPSVFFLK